MPSILFGVELEYMRASRVDSPDWEYGTDPSLPTTGLEFKFGPHKLSTLWRVISDFCRVAKDMKFKTSRRCGYHLHIGVRDAYTDEERANIAASLLYLGRAPFALVNKSRRENYFCGPYPEEALGYFLQSIRERRAPVLRYGRYYWANIWRAYEKHGTFEIRLHQGTRNPQRIINWARLWGAFFEKASRHPLTALVVDVKDLLDFVGDKELTDYYSKVVLKYDRNQSDCCVSQC